MLIYFLLVLISLSACSIVSYHAHKSKFFRANIGVQDLHHGNVSRGGGLILLLGLFSLNIFFFDDILFKFILAFLPIAIISLVEDFYFEINPYYRIFAIFVTVLISLTLFLIEFDNLPKIQLLELFLNEETIFYVSFFLYVFLYVGIINSFNIIDGSNAITSLIFLSIYLTLSIADNSIFIYEDLNYFTAFIIGFLLLNFPFGKIFLGDLGAYLLGFIIALLTLIFFINNPYISEWLSFLLLFYPGFELIFSFTRKLILGKSPFYPDQYHLHMLSISFMRKFFSLKVANNLNFILLSPLWLLPQFLFYFCFINNLSPFFFILIMVFLYLCAYIFFYMYQNKYYE